MITKYLHIKTLVGFLFLLLATAACSNEDEVVVMPSSKGSVKQLQVTTMENATTRTEGDDTLNENLFVTLDYYFFANADDADADNKLLLHKSETGLTDKSTHTYDGKFSDEDLTAVFGTNSDTDGAKCYVYVVANLPVDKLDTETQADIADKSITLGQLMRKKFQTTDISKNGKQESFVMYGGDNVTLSVTTDQGKTVKSLYGQVKVKRDAAKVVLTVTEVKDTVHVADTEQATGYQVWQSNPGNMHVMFYNGVNKSTIHSMINPGYHYNPRGTDGIDNDCYFTLDGTATDSPNPWRKLDQGTGNANRTHQYPFYTYLSDWSDRGVKERASYMILMVPWQQVDDNGNPVGDLGFQYTYYQIETTPVNIDAYYENYFYQISINVGVLGSFVKPEPVEVSAEYMIVPWGEVEVPGTLREGRYLILETKAYTMNNINSASIPYVSSHTITQAYVTKVEYLALQTFESTTRTNSGTNSTWTTNTYVNNERFEVTTADNKLTLNHTISSDQYTRYDVTVRIVNAAGLSDEVVFTIYPAIYADIEDGGDAFINGRFGHVQNPRSSGGEGWYQVTGNYYRSNASEGNNPSFVRTGYGSLVLNLGTDNVSQQDLTKITVTSFSSGDDSYSIRAGNTTTTYTYKLTDPRVVPTNSLNTGNNALSNYWVTAQSNRNNQTTASWSNKNQILVGSSASDVIAPEMLICSGWGRTAGQNAQNFTTFEHRCAAYQEAGYPAGRWRIPTEAEIAFIYRLQDQGVIPDLFRDGTSYWASSGRAITSNNGVVTASSPTTAGVRCVYDVWYWGEEKMSANEFHAEP